MKSINSEYNLFEKDKKSIKKEEFSNFSNNNKLMEKIKKINVNLVTSENSNYKQFKTNEMIHNLTDCKLSLDEIKYSAQNVFNKLKNLIQKENHEENLKKSDVNQKMKMEQELLSISAKRKISNNQTQTLGIKYTRTTDFKNITPLVAPNYPEKFYFELNDKTHFNKHYNEEKKEQDHSNNRKIEYKNSIGEIYQKNPIFTKENHGVNKYITENIINVTERYNKNLIIGIDQNNINGIPKNQLNLDFSIPEKKNKLKNLDILTFNKEEYNSFMDSNIQGVNYLPNSKLITNQMNFEEIGNIEKNSYKKNSHEKKEKKNHRSNSCNSPEKFLDPKSKLKIKSDDYEKKNILRMNNSIEKISPKKLLNNLENNFNSIFNKTRKNLIFKNELFEKVSKKKESSNNINLEGEISIKYNGIENIHSNNNNVYEINGKFDEYRNKKRESKKKFGDLDPDLFVKNKTSRIEEEKFVENFFSKKLNNLNISKKAKSKLNEINTMTEFLKNFNMQEKKNIQPSKDKTDDFKTKRRYIEEISYRNNFNHKKKEIFDILHKEEKYTNQTIIRKK